MKNPSTSRPVSHKGQQNDRIILNVGGERFETLSGTLQRFPTTLLGSQESRIHFYNKHTDEYFFDRSRSLFEAILLFYQTNGVLRCPQNSSVEIFQEECRYFRLPEEMVAALNEDKTGLFDEFDDQNSGSENAEQTLRMKIWNIAENPETSDTARRFFIFSTSMVIISCSVTSAETYCTEHSSIDHHSDIFHTDMFAIAELIFQIWFLFELLVAVVCSPKISLIFESAIKWVDMITVLHYFTLLAISHHVPLHFRRHTISFLRIIRCAR